MPQVPLLVVPVLPKGVRMKNSARYPHLLKAPILRNLPLDFQKKFLDHCTVQVCQKRTNILPQGGPSPGLFILAHGSVDVFYTGKLGDRVFLNQIKPGNTFGEIEAISESDCSATCEVKKGTIVLLCPKPLLFTYLSSVVFVQNLTSVFHDRLVMDNSLKLIDQVAPVHQRLCAYLHFLSKQTSRISETQSYLADVVRCSRQTVNKELGKLRKSGIILIENREITVLDRDRLVAEIGAETIPGV